MKIKSVFLIKFNHDWHFHLLFPIIKNGLNGSLMIYTYCTHTVSMYWSGLVIDFYNLDSDHC